MKQLVPANPNQSVPAYYCLSYANKVYGIQDGAYYCAADAWNGAKFKHTGQPPIDVAVPVWFQWYGTVDGETREWGHVGVSIPNDGVYCSPLSGVGHAKYNSVSELARVWGTPYIGWSEDISNVRVVDGSTSMETINDDSGRQIGFHYLGRNGKDGRAYALGSPQTDIQGKPLTNAQLQTFFLSAESKAWRDVALQQVYIDRDKYKAQVTTLTNQVLVLTDQNKALQTDKAALQTELDAANENIKAKQIEIDALNDDVDELEKDLAETEQDLEECEAGGQNNIIVIIINWFKKLFNKGE